MVLTLYYLNVSPPSRSVELILRALGLTAQKKIINLFEEEQLTPEFLKLNPLHAVPVIDDNGFVLWESRAIMTYLATKYGKDDSLYPRDLQKRAIVDQRLHYSNDVFYICRQMVRDLLWKERQPTEESLERARECQENIEKLLGGNKFMCGDTLTVADYSFITLIDYLEMYSPSEGEFPNSKAWEARCKKSMPGYEQVNAPGAKQLAEAITSKLNSK